MKVKKNLLCLLFFGVMNNSFATVNICPSVDEIKNHMFHYWLPLYIENEELASKADVQKFQDNVTAFIVARWNPLYLEDGHCFYEGSDPILNKIVFAQDAWRPVKDGKWSWKTPDKIAECYSTQVRDCGFIE